MNKKYIVCIMIIIVIVLVTILSIKLLSKNQLSKDSTIMIDDINNDDRDIIQVEITNGSKLGELTIPKISLYNIGICEGVELDTLSHSIGHFENTNLYEGNVGLASHNAGSNANHFKNINKLEKGDEIYYKTKYGTKRYVVDGIYQIDSYDWSKLENADGNNRITLITCISDSPNLRLCVQGIEK